MALPTKGTVRLGAGVDFEDVDLVVLDGELDVHQAADLEFFGHEGDCDGTSARISGGGKTAAGSRRNRRSGCRLPRCAP